MSRPPPDSTRTDDTFPTTPLYRAKGSDDGRSTRALDGARGVRLLARAPAHPPALLGAPDGPGRDPALPGDEARHRPADRERLLLRLPAAGAEIGRAHV